MLEAEPPWRTDVDRECMLLFVIKPCREPAPRGFSQVRHFTRRLSGTQICGNADHFEAGSVPMQWRRGTSVQHLPRTRGSIRIIDAGRVVRRGAADPQGRRGRGIVPSLGLVIAGSLIMSQFLTFYASPALYRYLDRRWHQVPARRPDSGAATLPAAG